MHRDLFGEEHELFREQFRRFARDEIEPKISGWNAAGRSDRATWKRLGEEGFLGPNAPEQYGGAGADFLYSAIVMEELAYLRAHAIMVSLHADVCMPYITEYGSDEQKERYLPGAISGDVLLGICMTEPGTGSDLQNVKTRARRDGDHYVIDGSKTFISNGQIADLFVVVAKTDEGVPGHKGLSLFLVEAATEGFRRGQKLDKLGLPGQDTSELFFEGCRVHERQRLGAEGAGFGMLMNKLQQERLTIAVSSIASCRRSFDDTLAYVKERTAFGKPIGSFQNTQFTLADLATQIEVGQAFVDRVVAAHARGESLVAEASMAKWWASDLQKRVAAECLQLFGGYGFMREYPISGDYADAAVQSIYAGTNEIMKVIIARGLGLG
ncbi:MAG: acyl-CoA dehydrogenase family protein [Myxococcales bacterium]|nr:acyl-CoA dehydrogenase family protein [Myxococcales bacterium]